METIGHLPFLRGDTVFYRFNGVSGKSFVGFYETFMRSDRRQMIIMDAGGYYLAHGDFSNPITNVSLTRMVLTEKMMKWNTV